MRALVLCPLILAACVPLSPSEPAVPVDLPLLSTYDGGDGCLNVGSSAYTRQFARPGATLVACPATGETVPAFVEATGAEEVSRAGGYVLYSVPGEAPEADIDVSG